MADHVKNREVIAKALREELVGPAPRGTERDFTQPVVFTSTKDSYGPWRQLGSGEEVLQRDSPTKRYGVGVLFPYATPEQPQTGPGGGAPSDEPDVPGDLLPAIAEEDRARVDKAVTQVAGRVANLSDGSGADELDLSLANDYHPSSLAVSVLVELPQGAELAVEAGGGRYAKTNVQVEGRDRIWWLRRPVRISALLTAQELLTASAQMVRPLAQQQENAEDLDIRVEVFSRPYGEQSSQRLLTVCLVNRTRESHGADESSLFQARFRVTLRTQGGGAYILPYPEARAEKPDEEEESLALLYRSAQTFAVGHGCAADWGDEQAGRVAWVAAECLPMRQTPSVTPDVLGPDGNLLEVPMAPLAGLVPSDDGHSRLEQVIQQYEAWITAREAQIPTLEPRFQAAAQRHMDACKACAQRMRTGLNYIETDARAARAFQLANHAILLQQVRTRAVPRQATYDTKAQRIKFSEPYDEPDPLNPPRNRGKWRAFQIAFLLMSLRSSVVADDPDRDLVELIWFPTGGGKTEAYLGMAAFTLFIRRLSDHNDTGVQVLMRYTLRLLTTQQFQRAGRLICAVEHLRAQNPGELGDRPFNIGMWVGGSSTPNTNSQALQLLRQLKSSPGDADSSFALDRCPWCGAHMGPLDLGRRAPAGVPRVIGYVQQLNTVVFKCPDQACEFSRGLPILVIDEALYETPPSMVIGTVDKFAMLAWRPAARALFGLGENGTRVASPPGLIIQDELHLISGPLGSMVGLYEAVIEELCTDRRGTTPVRPKIVSSTATIRRYASQIQALYARDRVALFPAPGLEQSDSFFARYATREDGSLAPGRLYAGVLGPSLGSMQTVQVRSITALLQAPLALPETERDPWWTVILFFNSLRELGTTLTLLQSDIPDYQKTLVIRNGDNQWRSFWGIQELTGRAGSDQLPKAIASLEAGYPEAGTRPLDVCLASNILEVGIDIDRLSLMVVVGQPKTTSQYIQVTGRVGRSWWERPGLVVTLYGASKPRDRSHYEKFRTYHDRLYAEVEPTSVTPFSPPALDRALHALLAVYARQAGPQQLAASPYPFPKDMLENLRAILLPRVMAVDPQEKANFEKIFDQRASQWRLWQSIRWTDDSGDGNVPLLRVAGAYASKEQELVSWPTGQSMRSVDAESITEVVLPLELQGTGQDAE